MSGVLLSPVKTAAEVALDALALEQKQIANNIANSNTPGFKPAHVSFEQAIAQALQQGDGSVDQLQRLKQDIASGALTGKSQFSEVQVDLEMAKLNEVVLHYQAILEGMAKYGSLNKMAISGEVSR